MVDGGNMQGMTPVECYRSGRSRLLDHVSGAGPETPVGACPGWRVRDVVAARPFDALRALSGRRTEEEIRQLDWQGDIDAVIGRLSPFPLPVRSLGE